MSYYLQVPMESVVDRSRMYRGRFSSCEKGFSNMFLSGPQDGLANLQKVHTVLLVRGFPLLDREKPSLNG